MSGGARPLGTPLHDAASSRASDHAAMDVGLAGTTLMAAAAEAAARVIRYRHGGRRRVLCVCGGGANGGDGLVVAALLHEAGWDARAVVVASRDYQGDAAWAERRASEAGVPIERGGADAVGRRVREADLLVDALLGTGSAGSPHGEVARAIELLAATDLPVVALDVPSGVDASTGEVGGAVVTAGQTVTFHGPKLGLVVAPGLLHAGEVIPVDIGIPPDAAPARARLVGPDALRSLPPRHRTGSKYDAGNVLLVGGSTGMTGAIALSSRSALRAGAGIVSTCVPGSLNPVLEVKLTEPMTRPCPDRDGALVPAAADAILAAAERADAVVLGPGIGRAEGTRELVRDLLARLAVPVVLDADGLHAVGDELGLLRDRPAATVLTPHGGEASRLLGWESARVAAHRLEAARTIAERAGAVCLLKGADTLVASPDGRLAVREGDHGGLATAGTGDVLAGTIGALVARGVEPWTAAACGAAAHLEAARAASRARPGRAIVAGDVADHLALA